MNRWKVAQESERKGWENWQFFKSESHHETLERYWRWYLDFAQRYVQIGPEHKVLDIGSAVDGIVNYLPTEQRFVLDPLADFYLSYFDIQPCGDTVWIKGIMEWLPFDSDSFDLVFTTNSLDHANEPRAGLAEMFRILQRGGFLVLTVDCYGPFRRSLRLFKEKIGRGDPCHPFSFSRKRVESMIEEAGFTLKATAKAIGTMGEHYCDPQRNDPLHKRVMDPVFSIEERVFGHSCVDFAFVAQKP